jgi:primosomal protein N' (replication factor Y)
MNRHSDRQGLSTPLLSLLDEHLGRGDQALLFINRRGFAPALFCSECATTEECDRCDARMTIHARIGRLRCHHCGAERPLRWACSDCGAERIAVGSGTQRVTDELANLYPDQQIVRLDRDALTDRDKLSEILAQIESGRAQIIVGTQLLVKGHDFPGVTLVGVLNADQGLFGADFRAEERLAQTIIQVAGRAGRRDRPGEVVVQTHFPLHPLLEHLLEADYAGFVKRALAERAATRWPPYSHLAVWRSEAGKRELVLKFLARLKRFADGVGLAVRVLGPSMETMERRSGRYRGQLLFEARGRTPLHALIRSCLPEIRGWPETRRVRWSIDVDPVEL